MRFALAALSAAALATLAGCSDPVPQTPDGAFILTTTQPDPLQCLISGHTAQVGSVDSGKITNSIIDGTMMTSIDCNVAGTGTFNAYGKIDDTVNSGNYLEIQINSISSGATKDAPAAGTAVFSGTFTAGEPYQGNCNFYFEGKEKVDAGKIWVSFDCPGLIGQSGMSTCPVPQAIAVFENCLQTSAM